MKDLAQDVLSLVAVAVFVSGIWISAQAWTASGIQTTLATFITGEK